MIDIQQLPPEWRGIKPPTIIELHLSLSQVDSICRTLRADVAPGKTVYGCMIWGYGGCLIIIPEIDLGFDLADQDLVRTHEIAHCNGWRH